MVSTGIFLENKFRGGKLSLSKIEGAEFQSAIEFSRAAQRQHSHLVIGQAIYGTRFL